MDLRSKDYKIFEMFNKDWALVTAGNLDDFGSCTLSWGSLGNIWDASSKGSRATVTVYVHPARYTSQYLLSNEFFTLSFFPEEYRKALSYMGSHSGRDDEHKAVTAGLTPIAIGESVTFKEAKQTFLCRKIYQGQFQKENLAADIQEYYAASPKVFPDFKGGWQPHIIFMGEIINL
ncbi:MAG: flavin reductase [Eubacteriales bacterium]|nr:flavin reductase [Eubacteriales bacterium]